MLLTFPRLLCSLVKENSFGRTSFLMFGWFKSTIQTSVLAGTIQRTSFVGGQTHSNFEFISKLLFHRVLIHLHLVFNGHQMIIHAAMPSLISDSSWVYSPEFEAFLQDCSIGRIYLEGRSWLSSRWFTSLDMVK